jgi:type IV pilus assembly protein PilV
MAIKSGFGRQGKQEGFLLIEVLVAILIFSIGILAVVGLQAVMIKGASEARYRTIASFIAEERIAQIWADPNNTTPPDLDVPVDVSARLPNGTRTLTQPVIDRYQVTVRWQMPGVSEPHQFVNVAVVAGGKAND